MEIGTTASLKFITNNLVFHAGHLFHGHGYIEEVTQFAGDSFERYFIVDHIV